MSGWVVSEVVNPEAELTRLYHADYARLARTLGVAFDPNDAADAVQDAYLAAFKRWKVVAAYDDPIGWIRRVAVNRLLNEQRNRRRRRDVALVSVVPPPADQVDDVLDLRARLAALPPQMRVTVTLFYLKDLSGEEIAELLGVSASTVRSNLADARVRLRLELTEEIA